jgi:hypothetical protein
MNPPPSQGDLELTMRQLERMRSMQYAYHAKFFQWMIIILVIAIVLLLFGGSTGRLLLPFVVVTGGVMASFYLHFCDFARLHASVLERKINRLLGRDVLIGHRIESLYFYPLDEPKLSGFVPSRPWSFFSFFTLHWTFLWLALWTLGAWSSWQILSDSAAWVYFTLLLLWSAGNTAYLAWYFLVARDWKAVKKELESTLLPEN